MAPAVLGSGIYSFSEAARLLHVRTERLVRWFRGGSAHWGTALESSFADSAGLENSLSFFNLIEALVASKLRNERVSLIGIRKARAALADILQTPYPFAHKGLYTDGKTVFVRIAEQTTDDSLIDAIRRQHVFPKVILPSLKRIDYDDDTLLAQRWRVFAGVILDPRLRFGKPIVEQCGMPTSILASAYQANHQDAERVADWYGVSPGAVRLAVSFENGLLRKVA